MITRVEFAAYVENNDFIVDDNNDVVGYVYSISDDENWIVFDVVDDEGEHESLTFAPFDHVTIVESFEED